MFSILDLQENIYKQVKNTYYMSARFAGRHAVGFGDLSIDVFLEVQDQKYSWILYLIEYIAHGVQFCIKMHNFQGIWASGAKNKSFRACQEQFATSLILLILIWVGLPPPGNTLPDSKRLLFKLFGMGRRKPQSRNNYSTTYMFGTFHTFV